MAPDLDTLGDSQDQSRNLEIPAGTTSGDSVQNKLWREADLLQAMPQATVAGFNKRWNELKEDPLREAVPIVVTGLAIGAGTALALRNPKAFFGAGQFMMDHPKIVLGTSAGLDLGIRTVPSVADTWNNADSLARNKEEMGYRLGSLPSDYLIGIPAGGVGTTIPGGVSALSRLGRVHLPSRQPLALQAAGDGPANRGLLAHIQETAYPRQMSPTDERILADIQQSAYPNQTGPADGRVLAEIRQAAYPRQRYDGFAEDVHAPGGDTPGSGSQSGAPKLPGDNNPGIASGDTAVATSADSNSGGRGNGNRGTDGRGAHDDGPSGAGDEFSGSPQQRGEINFDRLEAILDNEGSDPSKVVSVLRNLKEPEEAIRSVEKLKFDDEIQARNNSSYDVLGTNLLRAAKLHLTNKYKLKDAEAEQLASAVLHGDLHSELVAIARSGDIATALKLPPKPTRYDAIDDVLSMGSGRRLLQEGRLSEAEAEMTKAISISDADRIPVPVYRSDLAQVKTQMGKHDEALALLRQAWGEMQTLELRNMDRARLTDRLAAAEEQAGNHDRARILRQQTQEWLDPFFDSSSSTSRPVYDKDLQMFTSTGEIDMSRLAYLKWLREQGRLSS